MIVAHYREDAKQDARSLIKRCHYSHNASMGIMYCGSWHQPGGLFGDRGRIIAAVVFSPVVAKVGSLFQQAPMLELKRLIRDPDIECPPLSGLISLACKRINQLKMTDLLISYADIAEEHHGGVYQSCSWFYEGERDPSPSNYRVINGNKIGTRGLKALYGTYNVERLRDEPSLRSSTIESFTDSGKHVYWKPLTKEGNRWAVRLGFKKLPYPKPAYDKNAVSEEVGLR